MRALASLCTLGAFAFVASTSLANGRFPAANQLVEQPGDPSSLSVRCTFGLLFSHDAGANFDWVCEDLLGETGDADPPIAVFADGSLAAAPLKGIAVTHDGGCNFAHAGLLPDDAGQVIDLAVARGAPSSAYAITWKAANESSVVQIFATHDSGATWESTSFLGANDVVPSTIDVAPTDPMRVYAAGSFSVDGGLAGAAFVSRDGGATFSRAPVDLGDATSLWISAVDPANADRVYARTSGGASDKLLVSNDAASTFSEVASVTGAMLGFALSPDGSYLAIGGIDAGVLVSRTDSIAPAKVLDAPITCLTWGQSGLYACGSTMPAAPFGIARSIDGGVSWTTLLDALADIRGPRTGCDPASQFASTCVAAWPAIEATLPRGSGGAAGAGGAPSNALGGGAGQATSPPTSPESSKSCGCKIVPAEGDESVLILALAVFAVILRRRELSPVIS